MSPPSRDRGRLDRRRGDRRLRAAAALAAAVLLALPACGGPDGNGPSGPGPPAAERSYRMGWFLSAPRPDEQTLVATLDSMASVSEVALVQEPPPWPRLLAGEDPAALAEEKTEITDFLRALGLEVAFLVDPLDGLDRTSETPELAAAGRSLLEPEIRDLHEAWVREVARRVRPRWMGLASEINTLGQHGDPELYAELVDLVAELAPEIRALSSGTEVFVSFQVEDAHGLFLPGDGEGFALIDDFAGPVDFLGLSSYPGFAFASPADVPDDHLSRFAAETELPLAMVEGGWSSASVGGRSSSPAEQAAFFRRYADLLDGVDARLWILLLFADLDLDAFDLPPDRAETLRSFARMGIADTELRPKAAFEAWNEIRARPLDPGG